MGIMIATSPPNLVDQTPALWLPRQQLPPRAGRVCPICGSPEIFDVTADFTPVNPQASCMLVCKCGAILALYPPRRRKAK